LDIADSRMANNQATGGRGGDGGYDYSRTSSGGYTTVYLGGSGGAAEGGGLYVNGGSLTVAPSTIASNEGTGGPGGVNGFVGSAAGGGLYILSNAGTATVTGSTLSDNSAYAVGGIYNLGTLTVSNSTLSGNSGCGIDNWYGGTLTVSNSTLSGNSGWGISNYGTLAVTNTSLSGNAGGGIFNLGTVTVSNSIPSGNSGGGINNNGGTLAVSNSTLSDNSAYAGGGIYISFGTVTVSNSTLSGNSANYGGGGICNSAFGTLSVSNSTLSGHSSALSGGGICNQGHLTVSDSTISENTAGDNGGGLYVSNPNPFLRYSVLHNTLIAGNFQGATGTIPDDVYCSLNPGGDYNLIGDGTGMTGLSNGVNGNLVGLADKPIDPLLGPLADNGGPTLTHALLPGSPALNGGNPNQLGVPDQRGVVRSGGVNIGAYQASASAFLLGAPDTVQAGVPFDVTVTAVDPFGQVAVGYTGTVTFSTSDPDPGVVLPADYTFTLDDGGVHTFTDTGLGEITLVTPGDQVLTVTDTADVTITGSATITVEPGDSVAAPDGSSRAFGASTTGNTTLVQKLQSSLANAVMERFFAALAQEESAFPWLRWQRRDPGELAGWVLDFCSQEECAFV
jgi:hypothetical protein